MTRYWDTSALIKLMVEEPESAALTSHQATRPLTAYSSVLAATETRVAAGRAGLDLAHALKSASPLTLQVPALSLRLLPLDDWLAERAGQIGTELGLRSLDAIHVATAAALGRRLTEVVTYDQRMIAACDTLCLPVASPGTEP